MAEFIYTMHNVRKAVGDKVILDNVTLSFFPGAKIGVVGPNGAGKSTMLKLMAGLDKPNNGDANLAKGATVGILLQEPPLTEDKTVRENVEEAVGDIKAKLARFEEVSAEMANPDADFDALMAEMGELQTELDNANAWDIDTRLEQAMDALQCPPGDTPVDVLSGGERRRVALCKLLIEQPDLLLLDEPTNHLDAESVNWLEGHLKSYPGAVLAVTHDRYFLDHVAEWICEVDRGQLHPYEGNYSTYLDTKRKRLQIEGKKDAKRAKILEKELEWVRSSPKARQAKNKARLARYEEMAAEAERNRKIDTAEINIPPARVSATSCWRPSISPRDSAIASSSRTSRLPCREPASSVLSAQTASVRRPCLKPSSGSRKLILDPSKLARRSASPTSTRTAPVSTQRKTSGRSSPTGWTTSRSRTLRSHRARTSLVSGSRDRINRSRQGYSPVVSATV